ncbi:MAG: hypothetical protein E7343_05655 [Clostridiales bacterium]|nr:hypothetical protein [Clostridiales bacterium]
MKKSALKLLSGVLALSFAFGASGCELWDSFKGLFGDKEQSETGTAEENAAFAKMKMDFDALKNYKGNLTATYSTTASMKAQDDKGTILQSGTQSSEQVISIDYANKKGFMTSVESRKMGTETQTRTAKEKLFFENGKYYSYDLAENGTDSYTEILTERINEAFSLVSFETIEINIFNAEMLSCFNADDFNELKKAHTDVYKESVEKQKEVLSEIDEKRDVNTVKADVSLTAFEKDGATTLEIVSDMATDSIMSEPTYATLKMETSITTKDQKLLEYALKFDATRELNGGTQVVSSEMKLTFDYSFDESGYNNIQTVLPSEDKIKKPSDDDNGWITFHVKVNGKEYTQDGRIYGYDETDSALTVLTDLQERYFGESVTMGQNVYLNSERTQPLDVLNTTASDLKNISDLYIEVTINDGYALFYQNPVTEKDVTEKKYKIVQTWGRYDVSYPELGFYYETYEITEADIAGGKQTRCYDFEKYEYYEMHGNRKTRKFETVFVNGVKATNYYCEYENKGFYVIDYVAEVGFLNPNVFDVFYQMGLY